jgi:hypothetical protein
MIPRFFFIVAALAALPCEAAVIYSGLQNIVVGQNLDGVHLKLDPGIGTTIVTSAEPPDWNTKPYLNPFFGGVAVASSPLLRPIITGTDEIVNIATGTLISAASGFATGENGSGTHVGAGAGQFSLGSPGLIGFAFERTLGGPTYYGWLRLIMNNAGAGTIVDWAYEDGGAPLLAGTLTTVPEPSRMMLLGGGILAITQRRRRNRPTSL